MASRRTGPATARRLVILLVAVALVPSAVLIWFGARLLQQDRELVAQRDFERRQAAAPSIVAGFMRGLADAERKLGAGEILAGTVRLELTARSSFVEPRGAAAWLPIAPSLPEAPDAAFTKGEAIEQRSPHAARTEYQSLTTSANVSVRAGAYLRLARVARRLNRLDDAIVAYRAMSRFDRVAVLGAPADLQGRRLTIETLRELGRRDEAVREADALEKDLLSNQWLLDGGTWGLVAGALRNALGREVFVSDAQRQTSELADALAREHEAQSTSSSRRLLETGRARALAIVTVVPDRTLALVVSQDVVSQWLRAATTAAPHTGASVRLLSSGALWAGAPAVGTGPSVTAPLTESGLPWTMAIDPGDTSDLQAEFAGRRRLFVSGLALLIAILAASTFFVWRVVRREMAIARLQTDFVAAVSHEFRTPLTSLRHVTDLLEESDEIPADRRNQFYRTLGRNTERLHRLVEGLLDFSRMETGRKPYALRSTDVSALVSRVVEEFQHVAGVEKATITYRNGRPSTACADESSLSTALWNLLDNAVKYSDGHASIDVAVEARPDGRIAVSVADRGRGIPPQEREAIFGKFIRGADAGRLGIKGTGLGLALVSHIVAAHNGRVELESAVGQGSTFTIVLPQDKAS